ncbi:MAG: DUF1385 domain-containing protein [Anaerolineae bacterium]|nr:DUF1385 domain-containing protein [Anaerolineae bacterium]
MAGVVIISLALGMGLFFVLPAAASTGIGELMGIENSIFRNVMEEVVKIVLFVGYLVLIGQMEDIKRVFRYHGAEHKTINAYEAGAELTPEIVNTYPIEHPRCGTAFLLNVILLSIVVNSLIGRPDNFALLLFLRIITIPVVAGIAYEWLRFTANHINNPIISVLVKPNLALQRLTTRQPDHAMCEVAIVALQHVLVAEGLRNQPGASAPVVAEMVAAQAATD